MIRLIGIDVDGTLLDTRGQMPQQNIDAIHDAVAAGIHVALVTGRSYPFARPIAESAAVVSDAHREQWRRRARHGRVDVRETAAESRSRAFRAEFDETVTPCVRFVFDCDAD